MGKWTPNYVDDVLHAKISNMVSGAIRRLAVEKEPSISYESFVNELDTGDSFTLSLVDILVKELAHRRTRPTVNDRRLLAESTIKGLHTLANNDRSYTSRLSGRNGRRTVNLTDYLAAPPTEMELDEEDDEFDMQDSANAMEGARVNSDLYDAFITNPWPPSNSRRIAASPSLASDEWPLPQPLRSPTSTSRPWPVPISSSALPNSNSTLSRQASLRRAARSRMVDFNDFTHRRRSFNRDSVREPSREASGVHPNTGENAMEPRDGPTVAWNRPHGRRFFPSSRPRQHDIIWSEVSDPLSVDASDESGHDMIEMPTLFDAPTASDSYSRASPDAETRGDDILIRAPRWRRRNLRATEPQSMLSRHASPVIVYVPPTESPAATPPARQDENELPVAYPTPGSSENETLT